jgi:hypothetical protein
VLHVSWAHVAKPKKVQTKHLAQLLYPYSCAVKWLDNTSALVLVRPENDAQVSQEVALRAVDANNAKDLAVVTVDEVARMLEEKPTHKNMVDYKGRPVRRMSLPSAGEFRFLVFPAPSCALLLASTLNPLSRVVLALSSCVTRGRVLLSFRRAFRRACLCIVPLHGACSTLARAVALCACVWLLVVAARSRALMCLHPLGTGGAAASCLPGPLGRRQLRSAWSRLRSALSRMLLHARKLLARLCHGSLPCRTICSDLFLPHARIPSHASHQCPTRTRSQWPLGPRLLLISYTQRGDAASE